MVDLLRIIEITPSLELWPHHVNCSSFTGADLADNANPVLML